MRLDLFLKRCCIVRRRSEAKRACDNGIVAVGGQPAKPGRNVRPGERVEIAFVGRFLALDILDLPSGNVSRSDARGYYRVVRDEAREATDF